VPSEDKDLAPHLVPVGTISSNSVQLQTAVEDTRVSHYYISMSSSRSVIVVTRGHSAKIEKQRCQLDLRRHFFSERVVNRWNSLPQHVIDAGSINGFKNAMEKLRHTQMGLFMGGE